MKVKFFHKFKTVQKHALKSSQPRFISSFNISQIRPTAEGSGFVNIKHLKHYCVQKSQKINLFAIPEHKHVTRVEADCMYSNYNRLEIITFYDLYETHATLHFLLN